MTTPRKRRRSETNATTTGGVSLKGRDHSRFEATMLTGDDSCYGVGDDRPKLDLVGIFGKVEVLDDGR